MDWTILENNYVVSGLSIVSTLILSQIANRIWHKRGLLTYFVRHSRIGGSGDDSAFGSVRVTWNNSPVIDLYLSTVELINHSLKDYENVIVRAFSNDTTILTERTEISGSVRSLSWSPDFSRLLAHPLDQPPTDNQIALYSRQREFLIPVLNRGQIVRFHFLNAPKTQSQPTLWLDILHKGVKVKFQVPQPEIMGVPQTTAARIGIILGVAFLTWIIASVESVWLAALLAFMYGLVAQIPGAFLVRAWRQMKEWFGG